MKRLDYKIALKYVFAFVAFFLAFRAINGVPLGLAVLPAFLCEGFCFFAVFAAYFAAALLSFPLAGAVALGVAGVMLCLIYYIYKKKRAPVRFERFAYLAVALLAYIFGSFNGKLTDKLIYCSITELFSVAFKSAVKTAYFKKFRKKCTNAELACLSASVVALSLGFMNFSSVKLWSGISVFVILTFCYFYKSPRAFVPAVILPLSSVLHEFSLVPLALSVAYCSAALLCVKKSRLLACFAVILVQAGQLFAFSVGNLGVADYLYAFLPTAAFLFFPAKLQDYIKSRLTAFDEKEIFKEILNDERGELSSALYSVSAVFSGLERDVLSMDEFTLKGDELVEKMVDEVILETCGDCPKQRDCLRACNPVRSDLFKLINVGVSKGKVSLIDLSKDFSSYCYSTNGILYEVNKLLAEYENRRARSGDTEKEKALIAAQSGGVSEVLKNLAFSYAGKLDLKNASEEKIFDALRFCGIVPEQIVSVGEDELHLLFNENFTDFKKAARIIGETLKKQFCLVRKTDVGRGVLCTFKKAPAFDASFGVAKRTKDGSDLSGDTYSLCKINEGRFLVALCDGMGSGKRAGRGSASAISLIESLSRAGLSGEAVARLSNGMLSLCSDESFSALDMALIDLYGGDCDIMKVGAPFGLLLTGGGVKVLDKSSLPLGILDDVSPQSVGIKLKGDEMLVLMSDGVTDAFFSSTDAVEFMQQEKCKNPQTLAEKILERALYNNGGEAKDDMTALVMKIYKRETA